MRNLLEGKNKYYKSFADGVYSEYLNMRFGLDACSGKTNMDLASMRKEIVDWQAIEDEGALTEVSMNYMGWLPVYYYEDDQTVQFTPPSQYTSPYQVHTHGTGTLGVNFGYGSNQNTNLIQVNSGGCVTNINLSPVVNIGSSYMYEQQTPAAVWDIIHNLAMVPNVRTEDLLGVDIEGVITVIDINHIQIEFSSPVTGRAYLS